MAMTDSEINKLVEKLKNKYSEYSRKNPVWFNLDAFEDRLLMAVRNRMNMEGFILAEISNFEKIRTKYEKKKNEKSFSQQVDRIIDEQLARIKKYDEIKFHPKAGVEISHFYGALTDFALHYLEALFLIAAEKSLKDRVISFAERLRSLAVPRGKLPCPRIEDHIVKLKVPGTPEIEIEKDKNDYLKESAFLLHEIDDFCDGLLESRDPEWGNPLQMKKLTVEKETRKRIMHNFAGLTGYGAIMKVRDQAKAIIDDFRLGAFRKQG
jgi:hypothetical protein